MEVVVFISMIACTGVLAFNLYALESSGAINIQSLIGVSDTLMIVGSTFGYFYLSEVITASLLDIGDFFYDSPWYRLPANQQRIIMLPMERAHQVFRLTGLGLFEASMIVFSTVGRVHSAIYFIEF